MFECSRLTSILEVIKPPQTDNNFVSLIAGVNCSSTDNAHTLKNLLQVSLNYNKNNNITS